MVKMLSRFVLGLVAVSCWSGGTAHADTTTILCAKNSSRVSVRSRRVNVRLPTLLTSTTSSCPSGYSQVNSVTVGETLGGTLSSGSSLTGLWNLAGPVTAGFAAGTISFQKPLASAPTVEIVPIATSSANCPGSAAAPAANSGYLCIYVGAQFQIDTTQGSAGFYTYNADSSQNTVARASPFGAALYGYSTGSGGFYAWGSWAVKAP